MAKRVKKRVKILVLDIVLVLCLGVACYSGYRLYRETAEYNKGKNAYEEIKEIVIDPVAVDPDMKLKLDFDKLKSMNPDFAGWIYLSDSAIDYPFVHTDNNEFYLYHLFNREYNRSGCVFIDTMNSPDFSDKITVLYAHHMKNGTMFHDVVNYEKQEYYDSHKVIEIYTPEASYELYPVAGKFTTGYDDYVRLSFADDTDFMEYVDSFISDSTFVSEETIGPDDRIVLLSTCAYNVAEGRYALIGRLVKE